MRFGVAVAVGKIEIVVLDSLSTTACHLLLIKTSTVDSVSGRLKDTHALSAPRFFPIHSVIRVAANREPVVT